MTFVQSTEEENPYSVGSVLVNPKRAKKFEHALHASYDLNTLEQLIAEAIDETGLDWARNPSNGGFRIPLIDKGDTLWFYPDFLVWKDRACARTHTHIYLSTCPCRTA